MAIGPALAVSIGIVGCGGRQQATPATTRGTVTATVAADATTTTKTPPGINKAPAHATPTGGPTVAIAADPASTRPAPATLADPAALAAGHVLFEAQCAACHALVAAGISSPPGATGGALDHVGARRGHAWLEAQLVDPCRNARTPAARHACASMPSFAGLTQQQRDQIVAYLLAQR